MKKIFFSLFLVLISISSYNSNLFAQNGDVLYRVLPTGDRNADQNWDWTIDITYPLYWRQNNSIIARLPYFDNNCPLYSRLRVNNIPDIQKSDGWVLLTRDFGTLGGDNPTLPYFALYNKYRGTIRLFVFIGSYDGDELYAKMYFPDNYTQSQVTGLFAFSDEKNPYINDIDKSFTEIFASKNPTFANTWVYADFNAVGYDPNTTASGKTDVTLAYDLFIGNTSFITLDGGGSLSGMLTEYDLWTSEKKNPLTLQKEVEKSGSNYLLAAQNYIGQANEVVTKLRSAAQNNQNSWWSDPILNATTSLSSFLPGAKEALGFITQIFGISKNGTTQQVMPLKWKLEQTGEFHFTGEIHNNTPIMHLEHTIPGSPFTKNPNSTDVPLYRQPLGVFSITKPTLEYKVFDVSSGYDCVWHGYPLEEYECTYDLMGGFSLQNIPNVTINPSAGIVKRGGQVSLVINDTTFISSINEQISNTFTIYTGKVGQFRTLDSDYESHLSASIPPVLSNDYKIAYTLFYSPSNNLNDTLQYTRIYPVNIVYNSNLNKPFWACEIVGPTYIPFETSILWQAKVLQGIGPYTYKWRKNGTQIGTNNYITLSAHKDFTLSLEVTDLGRNGLTSTNTISVIVNDETNKIVSDVIPSNFEEGLYQNYPNPFNPSTSIKYQLKYGSSVKLTVFDILGEQVVELVNEFQEPGQHSVIWNGLNGKNLNVAGGFYIIRLQTDFGIYSKKMLYLK